MCCKDEKIILFWTKIAINFVYYRHIYTPTSQRLLAKTHKYIKLRVAKTKWRGFSKIDPLLGSGTNSIAFTLEPDGMSLKIHRP